MTRKVDQIRDRRARLEAELAEIQQQEREAVVDEKKRKERRIVRALRRSGLLSLDEVLVIRELNSISHRLGTSNAHADATTVSVDVPNCTAEDSINED